MYQLRSVISVAIKLTACGNMDENLFNFDFHFTPSFIRSFHWYVQDATIHCRSQEHLPSLPVINFFPATLPHQLFLHPPSLHLTIDFFSNLSQIHIQCRPLIIIADNVINRLLLSKTNNKPFIVINLSVIVIKLQIIRLHI
jgi:hypothetical protein